MAAGANQAHSCQETEVQLGVRFEMGGRIVLNKIKQQWDGGYIGNVYFFIYSCVMEKVEEEKKRRVKLL